MNIENSHAPNPVTPQKGEPVSPEDASMRRKLQGVLLFRLLLAVLFLVITYYVQSRRAEDLLSAQIRPLYYFSLILFFFTIIAALSLNRVRHFKRFAIFQLLFDVEAVTFLIYLSGGVESIFSFLYMPAIVSGAILLDRRGSLLAATACALSYGSLLDLQYFGWLSPMQVFRPSFQSRDIGAYFYSILMNIAAFFLTAYLSGYLAEQLRRSGLQVRKHEKDYQRLEFLHRNIIQSLNSGLLMIAPDGRVLFSNDAAQKILALGPDQIDEQPVNGILPTLDILTWPGDAATALQGTPSILERGETVYRRPDGEELCLGYNVSLLKKEGACNLGWVFIFQDLTRQKAMEKHLNRMQRMVFAGKLAAEIAHEVRNPLAAISGAAEMLQTEMAQQPFHAKLMNIVSREVQRIDDLITDFMWLARDSQKPERMREISVCDMIDEVLSQLKAMGKLVNGHQLEKQFEAMPVFSMDPQQLRQLLLYVMTNALEAMPAGGTLTVRVASSSREDFPHLKTVIEIVDTGSGIPDQNRERVFEPFFTTKKDGTGLGLSIVYQMMENMEGRIELHSDGQSGTSASLFFPFDPAFPLAK
jgi:two-component system sensor histidine kinase PilS (NtrC family)